MKFLVVFRAKTRTDHHAGSDGDSVKEIHQRIADPAAGYTPTKKDITENPLNLDIKEVEAANTASLLPDVAAAVINGGHAVDNGLNPEKDSIFLESVEEGSDNPYVNIIVARTADKDNELYKKVVDYFRTPEVAKVIEETYNCLLYTSPSPRDS